MLKKLLLLSLLSIVFVHGVEEKKIQSVMTVKVKKALSILQSKSFSQKQKEKKSIAIMDNIFDYKTMSKISLGKQWKKLTSKQQKQFTISFEKKLKASYIDKLKLYTNQKVISKGLKKVKSNRITLKNDIVGKSETYTITYLFYKHKTKNDWLIYDVKLAGVSVIQTYRKQFSAFLKTKSFSQLLKSL